MGRLRRNEKVRVLLVGTVGNRYADRNLDIHFDRPDEWSGPEAKGQDLFVNESDLIRAGAQRRRLLGCQDCVKQELRNLGDDEGHALASMSLDVVITSKDDCPSAHGDICEDDTGTRRKKKDPDDMDDDDGSEDDG